MLPESRIDFELVRKIADEFPGGSWRQLDCTRLHAPTELNPKAREWELLTHVNKKGGNYAFLFPESHFATERQILLDGPARRKIPFCFSTQSHPAIGGYFVAYVSKATNLNQRFQWHFSLAVKNTGAQVQLGLVKSGICTDRQGAVDFMLKHATIAYRELSGDEHTATVTSWSYPYAQSPVRLSTSSPKDESTSIPWRTQRRTVGMEQQRMAFGYFSRPARARRAGEA